MDKTGNKKNERNFRKRIAFTMVMVMLMSTISFGVGLVGSGSENKAYAEPTDPINEAVSNTLTGYYGTHENYVLDDWEEMAAVKASGGNLEDYVLPETDTGTASITVISSLLKGDIINAEIEANKIVNGGILVSAEDAYKHALNMIAIEAYNRSASASKKIPYSTIAAINTLLDYRTNGFFLDPYNQKPGGDMVGMSLIALSFFMGDSKVVDEAIIKAKEQIKKMQKSSGAFEGAWSFGTADANTTAVIVWGIMAADASNLGIYTTGGGLNPSDGLLSFLVPGGGYGYQDKQTVNAYATKQASLAMADIKNGYSYYANLSNSAIQYISAEVQVIDAAGDYFNKSITLGNTKSIEKAMQKALVTTDAISYGGYNVYVNGTLKNEPESVTVAEGDTILAVAKKYTKVAYFKTSDTDTMGVNNASVTFGGIKEITLVEKTLPNGIENELAGKPVNYGTALASGYGTTDPNGKIAITPVEANVEYEIRAKYSAYDSYTGSTKEYITSDTAILPSILTMYAGTPQTATVSLRIEGPNSNIYYNTSLTVARPDGSRLTVYDAVTQALSNNEIQYIESNKYISSINGIAAGTFGTNHYWDGWIYNIIKEEYLNGTSSLNGMGTQFLSEGEEIVVYYGNDNMSTVYPYVTSNLETDGSVTIGIKNYETNWTTYETNLVSTAGVAVYWGYTSGTALTYTGTTDSNGSLSIPSEYAVIGQHSLQISKGAVNLPDLVRLAPNYNVEISSTGTSEGSGSTST